MTGEPGRTDEAYVLRHESEYITPADAVAAKAQADVYNIEQVLHTSGVPLEQIHAAADLNAKNAKLEFEAKQAEDPIRRIIKILEKSAVSGQDQEVIDKQILNLEKQRTSWKNAIENQQTMARIQGNEHLSFDEAFHKVSQSNLTPTNMENDIVDFQILNGQFLSKEGTAGQKYVLPTRECTEKVLSGIGVLQPTEHIDDLINAVRTIGNKQPGKPGFAAWNSDFIENLPTSIPEIKATLCYRDPMIRIGVGTKILEKIVTFPASV